jgi:hypothetical protein
MSEIIGYVKRLLGYIKYCPKCNKPGNLYTKITLISTTKGYMGPYYGVQHQLKVRDAKKYARLRKKYSRDYLHIHSSLFTVSKQDKACWLGRQIPSDTPILHPDRLFTNTESELVSKQFKRRMLPV